MWTSEQLRAINERGKNIIVSAGAGSGKTAVLTNRILEHIKRGVDINSLLVLTFTKAAAEEMKDRIRAMLIDEKMYNILDKLEQAYITTFDAYSLAIVKKYFYKLNVNPSISIADPLIIKQKKKELIKEILMEYYKNDDKNLRDYLINFTAKNDTTLINFIVELSSAVDLKPNTMEYLDEYMANFYNKEYVRELINKYENLVRENLIDIIDEAKWLYDALEDSKMLDFLDSFIDTLHSLTSFTEIYEYFMSLKIPQLARGSSEEHKENKANFSKLVKDFKDNYLVWKDKEEMIHNVLETKETVLFLIELVKKCLRQTAIYKEKNDYYEFIDVAKMAIRLVTEFPDVRDEIKGSLSEILIDEYQDTSDLQETFIGCIANNNLYMVGDIKQSIYRFRNANPYIFKNKYEEYNNPQMGIKIDLNRNFRSRAEVLEDINLLFSGLMTNSFGDADYKDNHQMVFGNGKYTVHKDNRNYNLKVLNYSIDENHHDYKAFEVEGHIIAEDILSKMSTQKVYDKNIESLRQARFSDFCILIDKSTHFFSLKKILEYFGIPLSINADLDLNDSVLSKIVCHLINLVYHVKEKKYDSNYYYSWCSVARSFLFSYTDEQIYDLVISKNHNNEPHRIALGLAKYVDNCSFSSIYNKILAEFRVYDCLNLIGEVDDCLVQLEFLDNMLTHLASLGYTFDKLALYLLEVITGDEVIKYSVGGNDSNSVKIMTIHKSKGLEFPICYFPLLQVKFNIRDLQNSFGYNEKYGIIVPVNKNGEIIKTLIYKLASEEALKEEISEHIRLFYVGLTRAKEEIIIINQNIKYKEKYRKKKNFLSFAHFLFSLECEILKYCQNIDINRLKLSKNYLSPTNKSWGLTGTVKRNYYRLIIENKELSKGRISKELDKILSPSEQENINLGLQFHAALESLDFKNPKIDELNISPFIRDKVKKVLDLELFKNITNAKVFQEHEFYLTSGTQKYHGIIDLLVVYDDHIDIIDYKLANIEKEEYIRQLSIYLLYVKKISDLRVDVYLLSIINCEVKKLDL